MNITLDEKDGKLIIQIPPSAEKAREELKALGAKWNPAATSWELSTAARSKVADVLWRHFGGYNTYMRDGYAVTVKAIEDVSAGCRAISFFGREIIMGRGRDSGARPGGDVVILEGKVSTGGSVRYWETRASKGTVVRVENLDLEAIKNDDGTLNIPSYWELVSVDPPKEPDTTPYYVKKVLEGIERLNDPEREQLFALIRERYGAACVS